MRYRLINGFLWIIAATLVVNIIRSSIYLEKRAQNMKERADNLENIKNQQKELERNLAEVNSPDFVEKEARNKLNLGKSGEVVVLLPKVSQSIEATPTPVDEAANWQKWARLFW